MSAIKQFVSSGAKAYQVIRKVVVIDNSLLERVMNNGQVGWEVVDSSSDENFCFIFWDRMHPAFCGSCDGLYSRTRFESMTEGTISIGASKDSCVCFMPQIKSVMCGIGPAAEQIMVCSVCKKESK